MRRFLKWLILKIKDDTIDLKKAGVMGQLALYLLKAMGEGAIAFFTKPFDDEALLDSVRAVLKTRRSLP